MDNHFEKLARAGYGARGVVYVLLGVLALTSAFWGIGSAEGSEDALSSLLSIPFGRILLGLVAIGLIGHILWRMSQSLLDADEVGAKPKALVTRAGLFVSGIANIAIAFTAAGMALQMGGSGGGGSSGEQSLAASIISQPFGQILLGIVGVIVIAAGLVQIWRGVVKQYRKWIRIPPAQARLLDPVCRFGLGARGVVLAITGGFFFYAALTVSPEQAGGVAEALDYVQTLPFGRFLYALIALGLVSFGFYSWVEAAYRHVDAPGVGEIKYAVPGRF